jgi:hypothetical protein
LTNPRTKKFKRDIHGVKIAVLSVPGYGMSAVNTILGLLILGLLVWYAFWANSLGSFSYQEKVSKTRLAILATENNLLLAERSAVSELNALFAFARRAGLVEQKNVEYVFDDKGLAQAEQSSY